MAKTPATPQRSALLMALGPDRYFDSHGLELRTVLVSSPEAPRNTDLGRSVLDMFANSL